VSLVYHRNACLHPPRLGFFGVFACMYLGRWCASDCCCRLCCCSCGWQPHSRAIDQSIGQ